MPTAHVKSGAEHLPHQLEFIECPHFTKALIGGMGAGKTITGARALIELMRVNLGPKERKRKKRRNYALIMPSYGQGDRMITPGFREQLDFLEINYTERKSAPRYFDIPILNARVYVMSSERPDSLKGPNLTGVWIDEPFIQSELAYKYALSRLREPGAARLQILMTGTPEALNWGYDLFKDCPANGPAIVTAKARGRESKRQLFQVSSRDNTFLDPLFVANMEAAYDEFMIQAYIDGGFVAFSTSSVYYNFDPRRNVDDVRWQPGLNTFLTYDFNVDPMTVLIGQWANYAQGGFRANIISEISPRGSNTEEASILASIELRNLGFQAGHDYLEIYGDPAGYTRATQAQADITDYDVVRAIFPDGVFQVERSAPPRKRRFNIVNGMLKNSIGESRVTINPRCKELIKDLQLCSYKPGTRDEDQSDPKRTHKSDALGYFLCARVTNSTGRPRQRGRAI